MKRVLTKGMCKACGGTGQEIDDRTTGRQMMALRHRHRLTQQQVGRRMGISDSYLSGLERGTRHWRLGLVKGFMAALKVKA